MNSLKDDDEIMNPLLGDNDFERSLLSAGRSDSSSPDVEVGWSRFATQLAFVSGGVAPVSGVHPLPEGAQLTPPSSPQAPPAGTAAPIDTAASGGLESVAGTTGASAIGTNAALSALSLKMLLIGAVGGSLLLGSAWYALSRSHGVDAQLNASTLEAGSALAQKPGPGTPPMNTANGTSASTKAEVDTSAQGVVAPDQDNSDAGTSHSGRVEVPDQEKAPSAQVNKESSRSASSKPAAKLHSKPHRKVGPQDRHGAVGPLTAQVLLLDAARQAPASRALHLIDEFHERFPKAALRADAEIIALRALHTLGNKTDLKLRGEHFLRRYPSDTHAQRVRHWLTE